MEKLPSKVIFKGVHQLRIEVPRKMEEGLNGRRRFVDSGHDTKQTILPHFLGARLGTCSIVSDVNHFKHMLFSTFALC